MKLDSEIDGCLLVAVSTSANDESTKHYINLGSAIKIETKGKDQLKLFYSGINIKVSADELGIINTIEEYKDCAINSD